MKLLRLGFVAAMAMAFFGHQALAADAPPPLKIDPKIHAQSVTDAGPIVMQSGLDCAFSDAYMLGNAEEKVNGKAVKAAFYEIACGPGLGYIVKSTPGADPIFYNCLALRSAAEKAVADKRKPGNTCSVLPGNADPQSGLMVWLQRSKTPCASITKADWLGANPTDKIDVFEAVCSDGVGYYMEVPSLGSTGKLNIIDCAKGVKCSLFGEDDVKKHIYVLSAPAKRTSCTPANARYVGASSDSGDSFFEVGCSGETPGFMFTLDKTGAFKSAIDCAAATRIAGGCTFTNASAGSTDDLPTYQKLATQIGLTDCKVSKYQSYGPEQSGQREIAELACSNRPDGVVAMLPTGPGQTGAYYNCVRAVGLGLNCHLSPLPATYAKISSQIAGRGKVTCAVDGGKPLGKDDKGQDYVVVSCGSAPPLVLTYSRLPTETLISAVTCDQAPVANACTGLKK